MTIDSAERPQAVPTEPDDRGLARSAKDPKKRRAALRGLFEKYKGEVFGFLVNMLRNRAAAEDALQESFVRVASAIERFDASRPFRPWLYQIARNVAIDALRRRKEKGGLELELDEETAGRAMPLLLELSRSEQTERARAALEDLPAETRALLVQRHGLGMKLGDLAESLSVTERTVRNRLQTAIDLFARALLVRGSQGGGRS